jgi:dTMP kinase
VKRGKFVTFEGIDGAGKSTHLAWAGDFLRGRGARLVVTREPGGTMLGEELRRILLGGNLRIDAETEALMMFTARRQHLEDVIRPALDRGDWVLCDRFTDASFASQGGGRGGAKDKL